MHTLRWDHLQPCIPLFTVLYLASVASAHLGEDTGSALGVPHNEPALWSPAEYCAQAYS